MTSYVITKVNYLSSIVNKSVKAQCMRDFATYFKHATLTDEEAFSMFKKHIEAFVATLNDLHPRTKKYVARYHEPGIIEVIPEGANGDFESKYIVRIEYLKSELSFGSLFFKTYMCNTIAARYLRKGGEE